MTRRGASRNVVVPMLIGLSFLPAGRGWAHDFAPCFPPNSVEARSFPDEIPSLLLKALTERYGSFVRAGEDFNEFDVRLANRSDRRIIFVWQWADRWVFATEHGGRAYNNPVLVYQLDSQAEKATFLKEDIAYVPTVCDTAKKWIKVRP